MRVAIFAAVVWGDDIVAVRWSSKAVLSVGTVPGARELAPAIGCDPFELARVDGDEVEVCIPCGARADRRAAGVFGRPSGTVDGPARVRLGLGEELEVSVGPLRFVVTAVEPRAPIARARAHDGAGVHTLVAALVHASVLGAAWSSAGAADAASEDGHTEALRRAIVSAEREKSARTPIVVDATIGEQGAAQVDRRAGDGRPATGAVAAGRTGAIGDSLSRRTSAGRFALPGDTEVPRPARDTLAAEVASFGAIGLLASGAAAPSASHAGTWSSGPDGIGARGAMWWSSIGDAHGTGGLALRGVGDGGDGRWSGIGLGSIGIGHGTLRSGDGSGGDGSPRSGSLWSPYGPPYEGWSPRHLKVPRPRIRSRCEGGGGVSEPLPIEAVNRVVRQSVGRVRRCYDAGLASNPSLAGRVATTFVVDGRGLVAAADDAGSSLPDPAVVGCVASAIRALAFPAPSGNVAVQATCSFTMSPP